MIIKISKPFIPIKSIFNIFLSIFWQFNLFSKCHLYFLDFHNKHFFDCNLNSLLVLMNFSNIGLPHSGYLLINISFPYHNLCHSISLGFLLAFVIIHLVFIPFFSYSSVLNVVHTKDAANFFMSPTIWFEKYLMG